MAALGMTSMPLRAAAFASPSAARQNRVSASSSSSRKSNNGAIRTSSVSVSRRGVIGQRPARYALCFLISEKDKRERAIPHDFLQRRAFG